MENTGQEAIDGTKHTAFANAFAERAFVYSTLEAILRRAAQDNKDITVKEILDDPRIKNNNIIWWRIRDALRVLENRQFVVVSAVGRSKFFRWNLKAEPFTMDILLRRTAARKPSKPTATKTEETKTEDIKATFPAVRQELLPAETATPDQLELVFSGVTVVVGRNAQTGRLRIVIE